MMIAHEFKKIVIMVCTDKSFIINTAVLWKKKKKEKNDFMVTRIN